jgi:hypothetical protein
MSKKQSRNTPPFQPNCTTTQNQPEQATNSPAPVVCSLSAELIVVLHHPLVKQLLGINVHVAAGIRYQIGDVARLTESP